MKIDELKSLLSRFHIRPDKRLGQNFLLSDEVLDQIVAAAKLKGTDTVLEIGPGPGALTKRLAQAAGQVIAIEKDRKLYRALRKMFKNKKNVKIIHGDALFLNETVIPGLTRNLYKRALDFRLRGNDNTDFKLVANIPYYITGQLLQNFLQPINGQATGGEGSPPIYRPSLMVLLLQKEVAERIVAKPGDMSILSVSVQFYATAEIISYVSKENFYPQPEVDSAVIRLRVLDKPRFAVNEKQFFRLVKVGFSNKRKQLHNNLAAGLSAATPAEAGVHSSLDSRLRGNDFFKQVLASLDLNPLCRAQDLSLEDWKKLYDKLFQ